LTSAEAREQGAVRHEPVSQDESVPGFLNRAASNAGEERQELIATGQSIPHPLQHWDRFRAAVKNSTA
jgi:hypothetical protein